MRWFSSSFLAGVLFVSPTPAGRASVSEENLESLFVMIDGVNAAPTAAQLHFYEQSKGRFNELSPQLSRIAKTQGTDPAVH